MTAIPLLIFCLFFLAIIGVMEWKLNSEQIRAARLSDTVRDNEQQLSSIYNTVEDVIFHLRVESEGQYRFVSVNRSFCRKTGLSQDQVVGKTVDEVIPEPSLTMVLERYREAVQNKTVVRWEETSNYPRGQVTGEVSIAPVFDGKGICTHLVGSVHDITARKATQEKLDLQRAELVHLSRVTSLSELSISLSHELNQPLLAILNNAQTAQRHLTDKDPNLHEVGEILADIVKADRRAAAVIVKLRDLYKKADLELAPVNINQIAGDVLPIVHSHTIIRNISVNTVFDQDMPVISGDKIQLQQVILNLMLNSFDAMAGRKGGKTLFIRTAREGQDYIGVSIEDNGIGIDEQSKGRLFTPFFTTKTNGMGMGLVISKTIIESHGGLIWVENNPGPGATAHFRLPIFKPKS